MPSIRDHQNSVTYLHGFWNKFDLFENKHVQQFAAVWIWIWQKNLTILLVLSSRAITDFIFISCIGVEKVTLEYIYRTEGCRSREKFSRLMQSFINPHNPLVFSTISAWLKTCADRRKNWHKHFQSSFKYISIYF